MVNTEIRLTVFFAIEDGEKMKTVSDLIFLAPEITVDSDSSPEIKRHLILRRKAMTNLAY